MAFMNQSGSESSENEDLFGLDSKTGGDSMLSWADEVDEGSEEKDTEEEKSEEEEIKPISTLPLSSPWTFWYMRRTGARSQDDYEKSIKQIGTFETVGGFWNCYNHILRSNDLPNMCDVHLFRKGIRPIWEDEKNQGGGKWIIRLKKGLASKYWEDLVLAVVGEQFEVGEEICGIVCSMRHQESILSIWNQSSKDLRVKIRIAETFKKLLNIAKGVKLEYKAHDASLKDNSSFRNTDVYYSPHRRNRGRGGRGKGRHNRGKSNYRSYHRSEHNKRNNSKGSDHRDQGPKKSSYEPAAAKDNPPSSDSHGKTKGATMES